MQPLCHDEESYALLQFKESLVINESASSDPSAYPKVASWRVDEESADCCSWDGVECDGDTGHLRRLNLADNDFNNSKIPSEIRNLTKLNYLDLSFNSFYGKIDFIAI
ncbi:hypothetical protein POTOM_051998 [Populus tomentosa]|uniref:Leucine-rich repeat-containing N-terminal plant-type domain-containing protein n=1 Tax=Populus tomentosa TaxID=118781 RepID=A0A8X7YB46_POPTO|nr:hypothetical protein POTOM_051998 [Populus tomentosa]